MVVVTQWPSVPRQSSAMRSTIPANARTGGTAVGKCVRRLTRALITTAIPTATACPKVSFKRRMITAASVDRDTPAPVSFAKPSLTLFDCQLWHQCSLRKGNDNNTCVCDVGFVGDGFQCRRPDLLRLSPESYCQTSGSEALYVHGYSAMATTVSSVIPAITTTAIKTPIVFPLRPATFVHVNRALSEMDSTATISCRITVTKTDVITWPLVSTVLSDISANARMALSVTGSRCV